MSTTLPDCIEDRSHDEFRWLLCGHAYCVQCLESLKFKPECPSCRERVLPGQQKGYKLYLQFADAAAPALATVSKQANYVKERMGIMKGDSAPAAVVHTSQQLLRVAEGMSDRDSAQLMLEAIKDFEDRITPLFTRRNEHQKEAAALKRTLDTTRDELLTAQHNLGKREKQLQRSDAENRVVQRKFEEAEKLRRGFDKVAQKSTKLLAEEKAAREKAEADLDAFSAEIKKCTLLLVEKDTEVSRYKDWAAAAKSQSDQSKRKVFELKTELAQVREQLATSENARKTRKTELLTARTTIRELERSLNDSRMQFSKSQSQLEETQSQIAQSDAPFGDSQYLDMDSIYEEVDMDSSQAPSMRSSSPMPAYSSLERDPDMPPPRSAQGWNFAGQAPSKKRKIVGGGKMAPPVLGRSNSGLVFPLKLDRNGKAQGSIDIGPAKNHRRLPR